MSGYRLYGQKGSGSALVEAALGLADAPVALEEVSWDDLGWESRALRDLNPLGQLPTLVTPDGQVMTESAAILLLLAERYPEAGLAPAADRPERAAFLRWLVFMVAAVYPTFTYGDVPERWVEGDAEAGSKLRRGTDHHRKMLWRHLEGVAGEPWFLGERFSSLDLYLWLMRYWRPGPAWFAQECPIVNAIGRRAAELPAVARVQARHFPDARA